MVTMPCGGDAKERNVEVLTEVSAEEPLEILFGRQLPTKDPSEMERAIVTELVRSGLTATPSEISEKLSVSDRHVRRVRVQWTEAINELLADLVYLDLKGSDVYDAMRLGILAKPLLDGLAMARLERPTTTGIGQSESEFMRPSIRCGVSIGKLRRTAVAAQTSTI